MQYVSGYIAFGIPCSRDSVGVWNIPKEEYTDNFESYLMESENTPLGTYGIEKNKLVPKHEYVLYNVADHVRAYCDLLYLGKFDILEGLFDYAIKDLKCRKDIFMVTYGKLGHVADFDKIHDFMCDEFGNAWVSYVNAVQSNADFLDKFDAQLEKEERARKERYGKEVQLETPNVSFSSGSDDDTIHSSNDSDETEGT